MPTFLEDVLGELDAENVNYAVLRDDPRGDLDDLDLLVWPSERERFVRIIEALGFRRWRHRIPGKDVYSTYQNGKLQILDVHYSLIQNGLVYLALPPPETIIRGPYASLAPGDELLHLVFHGLLGKRGISEKRLARVRRLIDQGAAKNALSRLSNSRLLEIVKEVIAAPEQFAPRTFEAEKLRRRARHVLLLEPANFCRWFCYRALRRIRRRRGLLVAFMGVDGAGKSTISESVRTRLRDLDRMPVHSVYMGPWGYFRTRLHERARTLGLTPPKEDWLERIWARCRGKKGAPPLGSSVWKWIKGSVRGLGYYATVYYELLYRYYIEIRPTLRHGGIVLCDRYIFDLRYLHANRPIRIFPLTRMLLCRLFPRPRLVIFLYGDPETITARKAQLTPEQARTMQRTYRRALRGMPMLEIQTDGDVNTVTESVTAQITAAYFARA